MTIQQMHIAIEQKLQNANSYVFENFEPEEIDLFINEEQENLIKQRLYPASNVKKRGFEDTSKRLADLQSLVKEIAIYPVLDDTRPDTRRYLLSGSTIFPSTSTSAGKVYQIVSTGNTDFTAIGSADNSVGTVFTASGVGTGTGTVTLFDFYMPVTARINIVVNVKPLVVETGITTRYLGLLTPGASLAAITPVRGDFYITAVDGTYSSPIGTVTKGTLVYYNGSAWSTREYPPFNYPSFNLPVRIVEHEDVFRMAQNPFAQPTERSLIGVLRENSVRVVCSERFILKDLLLTYIRKPRQVSLTSSYNCELPEHTHLEIVDMVVNRILEVIEARRYQSASQESLKNE